MSYHLFSFCGSLQDYKIHVDVEIVNIFYIRVTKICLNFGHRASYIQTDGPLLPTVRFLYIQSTNIFNLYAPCILYIGQTYRYSPQYAFYIFSQQIYLTFMHRASYIYIGQMYRYSPQYAFYIFSQQIYLIFMHRTSYIQDRHTATPHSTLFIYLINKYISLFFLRFSLTIFIYSSTKCCACPNVTLLGS